MVFEVFGVLLAAVIQGIVISIYGSKINCDVTTLGQKSTISYSNNLSLVSSNIDDYSNSNKLVFL